MTRMYMYNKRTLKYKGFTLVELIVVLAVMSILLGITIFSAAAWIDWSRFKQQNTAAEEIFFAAQNQLTELDSSGALSNRIQENLLTADGKYSGETGKETLVLGRGTEAVADTYDFNGITYSDGSLCDWNSIWTRTGDNNNTDKVERTIVRIVTEAGDYTKYINKTFKDAPQGSEDAAKRFMFDMIASYISDKSVLDGAIALEFSPEAAQVFAVCYSDSSDKLSYTEDTTGNTINIKNRSLSVREDAMLGYYGVDTMTAKMLGHGKTSGGFKLELQNATTFNMILSKNSLTASDLTDEDQIEFTISGSDHYDNGYSPQFAFTIKYGDIVAGSFADAVKSPMTISPKFSAGIYQNQEDGLTFHIPVWKKDGKIFIILDAADVQAQSLTYAIANGYIISDDNVDFTTINTARERFRNTYSFFRFGLNNVNYIRADAEIHRFSDPTNPEMVKGRRFGGGLDDSYEYGDDNEFHGESIAFANWKEGDPGSYDDNTEEVYGIENGRHFYNIRYKTDYKQDIKARKFIVRSDIDWNNMIDGSNNAGLSLEHTNFFLNSYDSVHTTTETKYASGINISGTELALMCKKSSNASTFDYPETNTAYYTFPGFRMLGYGDTFTQQATLDVDNPVIDKTLTDRPYIISNLNISFAANCLYGVYGEKVRNYIDKVKAGFSSNEANISSVDSLAKSGALPLGVFAQSYGTINNIEFDDVVVTGMQAFPFDQTLSTASTFLFTSKVGIAVGENFGQVSNVFIDVNSQTNTSFVNGRTDIGGVVGHQYYGVKQKGETTPTGASDYTLSGCINKADVRGLAYVGGIIGRIYPHGNAGGTDHGCDIETDVNGTKKFFSDVYIIYGDSSLTDTFELSSYTIDKCKNYGEVSIDEYVAKYGVDGVFFQRGFYFGGITGAAINSINKISGNNAATNNAPGRVAIISNCLSAPLYTETEINNIMDKNNPEYYGKRRLRANYVGGIVGGARFANIVNCSTIADINVNESESGRSFVFGDRYVGGIAGYSWHSTFEGGTEYTKQEIGKIITIAENKTPQDYGYRNDYNIINGTNVLGNYAVGGITGSLGFQTRISSVEYHGEYLEKLLVNTTVDKTGKYDLRFPFGSRFANLSNNSDNHTNTGFLNTAVVLGNSNSCLLDVYDEVERTKTEGLYFHAIGGITGYNAERLNNIDNIQTEDTKLYALRLYGFDVDASAAPTENDSSNVPTVKKVLGDISVEKVQEVIDNSQFVSDTVGGVIGFTGKGGNLNETQADYSRVDAIVFGRNRVGGLIGDTASENERTGAAVIANLYPYKHLSTSSGMYVLGKSFVGGLIGSFADYGSGFVNGKGDNNAVGRFNPTTNKGDGGTSSSLLYDGKSIDYGYTVIGENSVGGAIGIAVDATKAKDYSGNKSEINVYSINIKIGQIGLESEKVTVKGNIFTGGIIGYQEYSGSESACREFDNGRYHVEAYNIDVNSKYFAGGIAGAVVGRNNYVRMDRLVNSESILGRVSVTSDIGSGGVAGCYATTTETMLDIDKVEDYKSAWLIPEIKTEQGVQVVKSQEGVKNEKINAFVSDMKKENLTLLENYSALVETFKGFVKSDSKNYDFTEFKLIREESKVSSKAKIFAGGFIGYIPDSTVDSSTGETATNLEFHNYVNNSSVETTSSIISAEAGMGDETNYSYLGGIIGRVPLGVTIAGCSNKVNGQTNGEIYRASEADYLGGLTELNAGIVTGNVSPDSAETVVNTTAYTYSYGGVAAFVGVNGNGATDGVHSGVISLCSNTAPITCENVAGIAAAVGGSSTIDKCYNHGDIIAKSYSEHSVSGTGAGIVGSVLSAATGDIVVKNCVNTGLITVDAGSTNTEGTVNDGRNSNFAAGIAYRLDYNGLNDSNNENINSKLSLCRNYGTGLNYGITAYGADTVVYNFDASDSSNHIDWEHQDNGTNTHTSKMLNANFFIDREEVFFDSVQTYSNGFAYVDNAENDSDGLSNPIINLNYSAGDATSINSRVLDKDAVDSSALDDAKGWQLSQTTEDNQKKYCTFVIDAVDSQGNPENDLSADMSGFEITWGNYIQKDLEGLAKYYKEKDTNSDYQNYYFEFIGKNNLDNNPAFFDDNYEKVADSMFSSWKIWPAFGGDSGKYHDYALSTYGNMIHEESYNSDMSDSQKMERYKTLLADNIGWGTANIIGINYLSKPYYLYARQYNSEKDNGNGIYTFPNVVGGYKSPVNKTFLDYAVEELNYGSSSFTVGSENVSYKEYNLLSDTSGNLLSTPESHSDNRYIGNHSCYTYTEDGYTRGYFLDPESASVSEGDRQIYDYYSMYCFGVYCLMKEQYSEELASMSSAQQYKLYIQLLYENIEKYGYRTYLYNQNNSGFDLKYYLIFQDINGKKLSTGQLTAGLNDAGCYVDSYLLADFVNADSSGSYQKTINGNVVNIYKDDGFEASKIKKITVVASSIRVLYDSSDNMLGVDLFRWSESDETTMKEMVSWNHNGVGSNYSLQEDMNGILEKDDNSLNSFYVRPDGDGEQAKYKLMLHGNDTGIDAIRSNPYDASYWSDSVAFDPTEANDEKLKRYNMFMDMDEKYLLFIIESVTNYSGEFTPIPID